MGTLGVRRIEGLAGMPVVAAVPMVRSPIPGQLIVGPGLAVLVGGLWAGRSGWGVLNLHYLLALVVVALAWLLLVPSNVIVALQDHRVFWCRTLLAGRVILGRPLEIEEPDDLAVGPSRWRMVRVSVLGRQRWIPGDGELASIRLSLANRAATTPRAGAGGPPAGRASRSATARR